MNFDPKANGPDHELDDVLDEGGSVIPIFEAPNWKPEPFRVAGFYTTNQMAHILNVDPSTHRRYRRRKEPPGPKATFISERVWRYYHDDFVEWLNKRGRPMDAA